MQVTYTVLVATDAEGGYTVLVPALAGCVTEADTIAGALRSAEEAIACHVDTLLSRGEPVPEDARLTHHVK
jgi:predicted RNase H-like HicB family nuclease